MAERDNSFVWAVCPGCHETWTDDTDESKEWVIQDVVDECRAHLTATRHAYTFDVGMGPLDPPENADCEQTICDLPAGHAGWHRASRYGRPTPQCAEDQP